MPELLAEFDRLGRDPRVGEDPAFAIQYLDFLREDGDEADFAIALRQVALAKAS